MKSENFLKSGISERKISWTLNTSNVWVCDITGPWGIITTLKHLDRDPRYKYLEWYKGITTFGSTSLYYTQQRQRWHYTLPNAPEAVVWKVVNRLLPSSEKCWKVAVRGMNFYGVTVWSLNLTAVALLCYTFQLHGRSELLDHEVEGTGPARMAQHKKVVFEDYLSAGNVIGEMSLLTGKPRNCTAICETAVQVSKQNWECQFCRGRENCICVTEKNPPALCIQSVSHNHFNRLIVRDSLKLRPHAVNGIVALEFSACVKRSISCPCTLLSCGCKCFIRLLRVKLALQQATWWKGPSWFNLKWIQGCEWEFKKRAEIELKTQKMAWKHKKRHIFGYFNNKKELKSAFQQQQKSWNQL